MRKTRPGVLVLVVLLVCEEGLGVFSQPDVPFEQPAEQVYNEMQTVYYGNLARRDNGVPPLRWNASMTEAARWFGWDSVENRPGGYCGHQDTLDRWPSERVPLFGYQGACGAENSFCGYVLPQAAIEGWMNSPGHRANLLDPNSREIGMGYYRRVSDGRGYLTQDFGHDPSYSPVIINHEALNITHTTVALYIHDRESGGGFAGLGQAVDMQVANEPCFSGVSWESYEAEKFWSIEHGKGWHTVYVKTRDAVGRTAVVTDTIYLGASVPLDELGLHMASTHTDRVTLYHLDMNWPQVQISQNWFVDDQFETFGRLWGNGERVSDPAAKGGTAFRMWSGDGESSAWVWTTQFFKGTPFVAYVRLKVSDNTSTGEVARFSIEGGGTEYGPLSLKGSDFTAPNVYQEFALAFTFHDNPNDVFLAFQFWRSGDADVTVDGVTIFTAPRAVQSPLTWEVPGGNYRGGNVWVRYVDGTGGFSAMEDAQLIPLRLMVLPAASTLMVEAETVSFAGALTVLRLGCVPFTWTVRSDAGWLQVQPDGDRVRLQVDASSLVVGSYQTTVTVEAEAGVFDSPVNVPVHLLVVEELHRCYLPLVARDYEFY
jgi:hypothetical protein